MAPSGQNTDNVRNRSGRTSTHIVLSQRERARYDFHISTFRNRREKSCGFEAARLKPLRPVVIVMGFGGDVVFSFGGKYEFGLLCAFVLFGRIFFFNIAKFKD